VALNIKEGLYYLPDTLNLDSGKYSFKLKMIMEMVPKYGGHAKAILPRLKTVKGGKKWDEMVRKIEQGEPGKEKLISFDEARQVGMKGNR